MVAKDFLPRAIPLVTVDPYFNIWSFSDHLYDDTPRHWTGHQNSMTGIIRVDGKNYRFMGLVETEREMYYLEPEPLRQLSVKLTPTRTVYTFGNEAVELRVTFTGSLLLDDLDLMSRPASYVFYEVRSVDGKAHEVTVYLDISSQAAVNESSQTVLFGKDENGIYCGRGEEGMLTRSGDDLRIDWGWLHLAAPDHQYVIVNTKDKKNALSGSPYLHLPKFTKLDGCLSDRVHLEQEVREGIPCLGCLKTSGVDGKETMTGLVILGYDDIHSIEYFGKQADAYWKRDGRSFDEVFKKAIDEYEAVSARTQAFDEELKKEALVYGEEYYDILCVAYRESIAAHKLIEVDGEIRFFSKECYSNGCIGTVDVTYPSIPLYLKYQPKLVEGMIDPIFHYAAGDDWKFPYAPHDVGQYPLANGQVYGYDRKTRVMQDYYQMPVEECGNMILCVAALCKAENSLEYAKKHQEILTGWADYLVSVGWDPENQLCTDDFAGHLAHNCNLAIKGILGIAAWAQILKELGDTEKADSYRKTALSLAETWKEKAFDGDHYRLTFDGEGSWSLKYNLIWDKLLDLRIFDPKIAKTEVAYYLTRMNPYGIPLDSRCDYTKSDWEMWTVVLDDNEEYRKQIIHTMWKALCSLDRRAPFPDWYHTETPVAECFQNRTVQGGLFIPLLNW